MGKRTYHFAIYENLAANNAEMWKLVCIVEAYTKDLAVQGYAHSKQRQTPGFVKDASKPSRRYYYGEGFNLCVREASPEEVELWKNLKRRMALDELSDTWDIATCQIIGKLAAAAGVKPSYIDASDEYLARKTAAQLVFAFEHLTPPLPPKGAEAVK
jgi:hypothetical protein